MLQLLSMLLWCAACVGCRHDEIRYDIAATSVDHVQEPRVTTEKMHPHLSCPFFGFSLVFLRHAISCCFCLQRSF